MQANDNRVVSITPTHPYTHANDVITISGMNLSLTQLAIEYTSVPLDGLIISTNKYGDRTFFGDNWPARGSNYIPCVDHVSEKATITWVVTHPAQYLVISNGAFVDRGMLFPPCIVARFIDHHLMTATQ